MLNINFNPFPLIAAERLLLKKVEMSDVNEIFYLRSNEKVMKYIDRPPAKSLEEAAEFIKKITELEANNEAVTWAITIKENPKLIGTICYWNIQKEHYRAEVGYVLHPDYWGKGIMQEAFTKILNYGFKVMDLHSIEANVNPNNKASIRLLERNNFTREAYFRENYFYNGKFLDSAIYSLLISEFKKGILISNII
ncbi:MAG: GNAT family N-acetyltransferase [Ignavibacteria bacterium]